MAKLLDETGLAYFWGKVKAAIPTKTSQLTNDSEYATASDISGKMNVTNPTGTGSFAMNMASNVILGNNAHVEGTNSSASGNSSHAEGYGSYARGDESHAEGAGTAASGPYSHAEGGETIASGDGSHAEGAGTEASEYCSHAEGLLTKASSMYQHVQGRYNIEDTHKTYAHIVGNGDSEDARSNAHTLDWSGNAWFAGKVTAGAAPTDDLDLATKKYVDEKSSSGSVVLTGTLAVGETELVFSDENIATSSTINIYTNYYGVNPSAVTLAAGSVTLTFAAMLSDIEVKVEVK